MTDVLPWILAGLGAAQLAALAALLLRRRAEAGDGIKARAFEERMMKIEAALREEAERARREGSQAAGENRQEMQRSIAAMGDMLGTRIRDGAEAQAKSNEVVTQALQGSLRELRGTVEAKLDGFQELAKTHRQELSGAFDAFRQSVLGTLGAFGEQQNARFNSAGQKDTEHAQGLRKELGDLNERLSTVLLQRVGQLNVEMTGAWARFSEELGKLSAAQQGAMEQLRLSVTQSLGEIRQDNERRLEEMRKTVDEKLHNTLEQRLGESFKLVSDRLEGVQKGLGEMQTLASGVGDLKRVLTNVKTRGTWGEVLLGNLLEQVLATEQYAANVATTGTSDRVEYAIRMPGHGEGGEGQVWLPIDSKFPKEDYERLLAAQEAGEAELAAEAGKALEKSIRLCAQDICNKYIESPKTTDFGIMFLPSEGLYAEVVRRTETVEWLQRKCKVLLTGPTTLAALLNSLQMGFRTLAIQKRSGEVWELLGAVKTEFGKYADVMAKVQKKLQEASNTIETAEKRTRAINRKLKTVEQMDEQASTRVFPATPLEDDLTEFGIK